MSSFERLHQAVQFHIVNSLHWRQLRPVQDASIEPIHSGQDVLILAQTAGGKTEAAFFPLLSRMLTEEWEGLSILYVSPLRALLNNVEPRLHRYFQFVGRTVGVWHGDVRASAKKGVLKDIPDCLMTTPESLEGLLCSRKTDHQRLFGNVRVVVVDEVHSFAADDRGWHLLALLSRLSVICGRKIQRIGLSATVGNPEELAKWLSGNGDSKHQVVQTKATAAREVDLELDYVGSLENAAKVIGQLHRGEKRLVFCDSRALTEQLAASLRDLEMRVFVVHSSLSSAVRRQAETAFAEERDCVVCATSALELGIDVGDLDRVIQINCPGSVASFLQRLGRTGRRPKTRSNCLFLALDEEDVLDTAALIGLWERGYVEPVRPPVLPYHILAQQIMALALQMQGLPYGDWDKWLSQVSAFKGMQGDVCKSIVLEMETKHILHNDEGVLWFGVEGEKAFGLKNFMELLSVFTSLPMMTVFHGNREIGFLDQLALQIELYSRSRNPDLPLVLTLAGRHWEITHTDWRARRVHVAESKLAGKSRWLGGGRAYSFAMAQERLRLLTSTENSPRWSKRTGSVITDAREGAGWLQVGTVSLRPTDNRMWEIWTHAGTKANNSLAGCFPGRADQITPFSIRIEWDGGAEDLAAKLKYVFSGPVPPPMINQRDVDALKFSACLNVTMAQEMLAARAADNEAWQYLRGARVKLVV